MERLKRAEERLVRLESGLLVALLSFMVLMSFSQIALRQFFSKGILWGDTLLRHLVLWVGFLGAGIAAAQGKHFAWEAAAQKGGKSGAVMHLVAQLATAAITALLVSASWTFLKDERAAGGVLFTVGDLAVPAWIFSAIIPAGFFLVLLHTLVKLAQAAAALRQ